MNEVITTISPSRPESISLDFEKLRAEGIKRLEEWAPFIWTDFNAHDPGITILEVLCYAVTDLAYRTRLPLEDLLASGPKDKKLKKFFEAEEILPTCPVTSNDYRKLIIDVPGVKNAWLEKAVVTNPGLCIKNERFDRPMSPDLVERLTSLFDEESLPKKLTEFEKVLISISKSEAIPETPKDQMGEIFQRFIYKTKTFSNNDINQFRQLISTLQNGIDKENLELLLERMEAFKSYFDCTCSYYCVDFKSGEENTLERLKLLVEKITFKEAKSALSNILKKLYPGHKKGVVMDDIHKIWELLDYLALNFPDDATTVFEFVNQIFCQFSYSPMKMLDDETVPPENCEKIALNGLYKVKVDLHDPCIKPGSKEEKRILKNIRRKLHQNRNLCEDFAEICTVEKVDICLCLHLEITSGANENEVMAEVIFQIQEFLTPTIRFNSLLQMLEMGLNGDEILNGPKLEHGFITDEELARGIIPEKIFVSDLYKIISGVKDVIAIKEFGIKEGGADEFIKSLTCLDLKGKKPIIDLCCTQLYASKNGFINRVKENAIVDLIKLKELAYLSIEGNPNDKLPIPIGKFREDLSEFTSVQSDFPQNYGLANHGAPANSPEARNGQIKQLQAYLTFYDRLMANYMQQLGQVKTLLAVEQEAKTPTLFYDALYEIPGIKSLIFQPVVINQPQMDQLKQKLPEEIYSILESSDIKGSAYFAFGEWNEKLSVLLGSHWTDDEDIRSCITGVIKSNYSPSAWEAFLNDEQNFYIKKLKEILEPEATQQQRKNQLLDHLLARFGEQFTDFSLQQFGVGYEVALYDDYCDYLSSKADYLLNVPIINSSKAKAYNCQKFKLGNDGVIDSDNKSEKIPIRPDVWNTDNVSGLKNKIYHLLNIKPANTASVFCDPKFRIDLAPDESAERPRFFIQMVALDDLNKVASILMMSTKTYSGNQAKIRQQKINESIGKQEWFKIITNPDKQNSYVLQFSFEDGSDTTVLQSDAMSKKQAELLLENIYTMIDPDACGKEGFHLIENILLRPAVNDDKLLKQSYTCDLTKKPMDPYSFWLTVVIPGWTPRGKDLIYRQYLEQLIRKETPAHIALCFKWLEPEDKVLMKKFEDALEQWREAKANCVPDACDLSDASNRLVDLLNCIPCICDCNHKQPIDELCECVEEVPESPEPNAPIPTIKN